MIGIQIESGKKILLSDSNFGRGVMHNGIICSKTPNRVLALIDVVKEVLIHIRLKYCPALP